MSETIKILTLEGAELEVNRKAAVLNTVIRKTLEDLGDSDCIPIPNVSESTFRKIMEWCENYKDKVPDEEGKFETDEEFDKKFLEDNLKTDNPHKTINDDFLIELLKAANFLENKPFLHVCCRRIIDCIKGKTTDEILKENGINKEVRGEGLCEDGRSKFNFTEEEEKAIMTIKPYEEWVKECKEEEEKADGNE